MPAFWKRAAVAGIEPASGRLTAACPYQHGPHRSAGGRGQEAGIRRSVAFLIPDSWPPVGVVGFEPTLSCSRSTRIPRLSHTPVERSAVSRQACRRS